MKSNVRLAEQGKKPVGDDPRQMAIWNIQRPPLIISNLRDVVIRYVIWWMRTLGVSKIMIKEALIGARSVSDVSFKAMFEQPPEELKACRNTLIRNLADQMTLMGVLEIEIVLEENEIKDVINYWKSIQQPPKQESKNEIKLNVETDPTGDKVISDSTTATTATADGAAITPAG